MIELLMFAVLNSSLARASNDMFFDRRLAIYPNCRADTKLPDAPENLVHVSLKSDREDDLQPCDRKCAVSSRMVGLDVKRFPEVMKLFAEMKKSKPKPGKIAASDGLISFPDLAVCIFADSTTGQLEFQDQVYEFGKSKLEKLRQEYLKLKDPR